MEDGDISRELSGETVDTLLPYQTPELIKLGPIVEIVQCEGALGNDGMHGGFCAS